MQVLLAAVHNGAKSDESGRVQLSFARCRKYFTNSWAPSMESSLAAGGMPGSVVGTAVVGTASVGWPLVVDVPPELVIAPVEPLVDAVGSGSALDEHPVGASATATTMGNPTNAPAHRSCRMRRSTTEPARANRARAPNAGHHPMTDPCPPRRGQPNGSPDPRLPTEYANAAPAAPGVVHKPERRPHDHGASSPSGCAGRCEMSWHVGPGTSGLPRCEARATTRSPAAGW